MRPKLFFTTAFLFFISIGYIASAQPISYTSDNEITLPANLPGADIGASTPLGIIHAGTHIYIYTPKRIIIYNEAMNTIEGEIQFDDPNGNNFGRFALVYNFDEKFKPDLNIMTFDEENNLLYFVSPELKVYSISTVGIDISPDLEFEIDSSIPIYTRNLHGYCRLEYDNVHNRLFLLLRTRESDLTSFGSFMGIYAKTTIWNTIYSDYQSGLGYNPNTVSNFAFNPIQQSNDFYLSRYYKTEIWSIINNSVASFQDNVVFPNKGTSKMIVTESNSNQYLIVFPYVLAGDEAFQNQVKIHRINTTSPYDVQSITPPSLRINDATQLANGDIICCYSNDDLKRTNITNDHDISVLKFNSQDMLYIDVDSYLFTNQVSETDNNEMLNMNKPFTLMEKADGSILVGKKNDIAVIDYNTDDEEYTVGPNLFYAKDNCFSYGVEVGDNVVVLNSVFGADFFHHTFGHARKQLNFPVYNTEYNANNRKMYLFNRLTTEEGGFFIYDLEQDQIESFVAVDKPIADLIYNKATNQVLVSLFYDDVQLGAVINKYDAVNGDPQGYIYFSTNSYPGRMFAAPNGKLYFSLNMKNDSDYPKIAISDASQPIGHEADIVDVQYTTNEYWCYTLQGNFCYNSLNEKVYASFGAYFNNAPPYQNSYSSPQIVEKDPTDVNGDILNQQMPTGLFNGIFLSIEQDNNVGFRKTVVMPGELLHAPFGEESKMGDYGYIYINSGWDENSNLLVFNCAKEVFEQNVGLNRIFDIEYCPLTKCVYALDHTYIENPGNQADQSLTKVYKIEKPVNGLSVTTNIWQRFGFAGGLSYNPFDSQLYLYFRGGQDNLGFENSKIFTLDPFANASAQTASVSLPYKNLQLEVVPINTKPHFDPYNNKAYFPNGTHSSVSVVGFTANEALALGTETDWLSIPRLPSNSSTDWNEFDLTSTVWDANNFQIPYYPREDEEPPLLYHLHATPNGGMDYKVFYKNSGWVFDPDINDNKNTWSCRGYQLNVVPDGDNYIYMSGNIKDPATSFPLYNGQRNWVGYFLTGEQDVFDALGASTLENLSNFKHRDYYCYRGPAIEGPTGGIVNGYPWRCDQQQTNIAYGDMIILQVMGNVANFDMMWQNPGLLPRDKIRPEPSYFDFAEIGTYTPILIELDYTDNPLEIGAFVDDSCMGAESVMESDTVIILRAYLNGGSPDSVVFQDWNGTKSAGRIIKDYTVYNPNTGIYENRALMSNTGEEMPRVSFRKRDKEQQNGTIDHKVGIWPNPAHNTLNYSFACEDEVDVKITLLDISGKQLKLLLNDRFTEGFYRRSVDLGSKLTNPLNSGVYLVKFDIGGLIEVKKLVIK